MRRGIAEPTAGQPSDAHSRGRVAHHALARFALLSLLAVVVLTVATLVLADRIARTEALDDARTHGVGMAHRLAAPLVNEEVRAGLPGAGDQLTTVMGNRMRDGSVRHVKLWDQDGRVLWSDQREIVGRSFELSANVTALFGTRESIAELSDHDGAGYVAEGGEDELLEVYVGAIDDAGDPLVFEATLSTEPMAENARNIVLSFVPLILGSLFLLLLVVLPLAASLTRQVERAQSERASMMRHALLASDLERRRIAEDLHNGVVQELAGLVYALPTLARNLDEGGDLDSARSLVNRATDLVQRNVLTLRSLMTDIYPPDLEINGLDAAVRELVQTEALQAGIATEIRVDDDLDLPCEASRLAYRVIREGLRNVVKHAEASEVVIQLHVVGSQVLVHVLDDGRGPGDRPGHSPKGHLGLRLLSDTVRDFGGQFEVGPRSEGGTLLMARFPVALVRS